MLTSIRHRLLLLPRRAAAILFSSPIPTPISHSPYSSAALINPNDPTNPTASYLVASCGLSPDAAAAISGKIRITSTDRVDALLALLRCHGLSGDQITRMVHSFPSLLLCDPSKTIEPKLDFFLRLGFSASALSKLLARQPSLLGRSLERHLVPCIDFLRRVLVTDQRIVSVLVHFPRALHACPEKSMRPTVQALRRIGVPEDKIGRLVELQPSILQLLPERINEIVEAVKAVGLQPTDQKFIYVFWMIASMKRSKWESKIALFRSFGFSKEQIFSAFVYWPTCMGTSEKLTRKKLEFFTNTLKLTPADICKYSVLLTFSLDKNIIPRCMVLSLLIREGKIAEVNLPAALRLPAKKFLMRYVTKYQQDVPDVVRACKGEIEFSGFGDQLVGHASRSRIGSSGVKQCA